MIDYAAAMKGATSRKQRAEVASAFLTEFLDARTDDGESIAEIVFAFNPALAQQFRDFIDTDTRRSVTVRFDFDRTDDGGLAFTSMTLVEDQTSMQAEDRAEIGVEWAQSEFYRDSIADYLPELLVHGGTLTADEMG